MNAIDENRIAIVCDGPFTYGDLDCASQQVAHALLQGRRDLEEERVAFPASPTFDYAAVQSGIWRAGGVAVPLAVGYPAAEIDYLIQDSGARVISGDLVRAACTLKRAAPGPDRAPLPTIDPSRRAMIVYTSGTTGRAKGVVTTHANIRSQIDTLVS